MKLMKAVLIPVLIFSVSVFFITSGCNKDDGNPINVINVVVDDEAGALKAVSETIKLLSTVNSYLIALANNQPINSTGCPNVTLDSIAKKITVDYGNTPCSSVQDPVRKSGKYTIQYFINSAKDSVAADVSFSSFRIYKGSTDTNYAHISGNDNVKTKKAVSGGIFYSSFTANNIYDRSNGTNYNVNLTLPVTVEYGSPSVMTDDIYSVGGTGTVSTGGNTYSYSVFDSNSPVKIYGDCRYPKSGKVRFAYNNIDVDTDFYPNNGACDAVVNISKYGVTITIDLGNY